MSINYIGRVIHNIKDFYSEINGATLTGAIDVVVVQQPDGNYTCSPFHVRFGKLGVLRSKEKIVDIEINGESQDIHMKLGESGEAFFVEELLDSDNEEIPEHLATSPIPVSHLEEIYNSSGRRRNSIDLGDQQNHPAPKIIENEVNDYTKRRYTADNNDNKKTLERDFIQRQIDLGNIEVREASVENLVKGNSAEELIFNMDDDVDTKVPDPQPVVKRSVATPVSPSVTIDMSMVMTSLGPKEDIVVVEKRPEVGAGKVEESVSNESSKSGKKKRRKKPNMKKKPSRKFSNVAEGNFETENGEGETVKASDSNTDKSSLGSNSSSQDLKDLAGATPPVTPTPTSAQQQPGAASTSNAADAAAAPVAASVSSSSSKKVPMDPDFHFFSDTELTSTQDDSRSNTPTITDNVQSDTEFEVKKSKDGSDKREGKNWAWGELPTQKSPDSGSNAETTKEEEHNSMLSSMFSFMKHSNRRRHSHQDGVYLADISSGAIDPEVAALYFSTNNSKKDADMMDCESGNGPSLAQSPNSPEGCKSIDSDFDDQIKTMKLYSSDVSLSLCGWHPPPTADLFLRHLLPFSDLCNNPLVLESPQLVVRVRDRYYNWKVAAPLICSAVIYQRPLPQSTVDQLCSMHMASESGPGTPAENKVEKEKESRYSWWYWRRSSRRENEAAKLKVTPTTVGIGNTLDGTNNADKSTVVTVEDDERLREMKVDMEAVEEGYHGSSSGSDRGKDMKEAKLQGNEKCRKSLRLTSEQISRLNLRDGLNKVEFTVTTAYQGTCRCNCYIYKWKWNDKIVISDIDGTITKSDVLGHILPIVGKDWAQSGVAELFNKIHSNGYKLLYLSARAIGQSRTTREYLRSIRQGDLSLPDGPVLLNPTSLLTAFHREVIEKKPEKFKISCMSDIRALFPSSMQPFYAGYGNRINDVWAYTAVGIPIVRIFTINPKGELKHELTQTFQSSYMNMIEISDLIFPPLPDAAFEYSQFMHWRDPVPLLNDSELAII